MKKTLAILIAAALGVSLISCGQTTDNTEITETKAVSTASVSGKSASAAEEAETEDTAVSEVSSAQTEDPADSTVSEASSAQTEDPAESTIPEASDITINETIENSEDGGHAILADGTEASYSNIAVNKTGEASGDEADFYGENAAVFATNGGTLDLSGIVVTTDGTHANGVFSYGEGTTVNISDSVITTSGNCSGGLMTTGGGTMNASNLNVYTTGNSSAAIRSDRGGGTVTVTGGSYTTEGTGSPAIYSTADITVNDAELTSTASQGIVIEGKNSVTLNNVTLNADNNTKNSDKSEYYQAVMIYQSMSGDASVGKAAFSMNGGTLTNANGDVFFVNNTAAEITLNGAEIINNGDGVFLRAAAAGWGNEGSNGGKVDLYADDQTIDGDMIVDDISVLNLYLGNGSAFTGAVNPDGQSGEVYIELTEGSSWTLTGDSYITALTCDADSIDLNGFTLYVNGEAYEAGTAVSGEAIEIVSESSGSSNGMGMPSDGQGGPGESGGPGGPGSMGPGGTPPEKPEGSSGGGR